MEKNPRCISLLTSRLVSALRRILSRITQKWALLTSRSGISSPDLGSFVAPPGEGGCKRLASTPNLHFMPISSSSSSGPMANEGGERDGSKAKEGYKFLLLLGLESVGSKCASFTQGTSNIEI